MTPLNNSMNQTQVCRLEKTQLSTFIQVVQLFAEVFEMENFKPPSTTHLQKLLERSDFIVFAALRKEKVVGGLTTYVLQQYYEEKPLAYIYDVAVASEWQRKGIGKQLITAHNDYCRRNGFAEAYVQADLEDEHAIAFYRNTKATEAPVVQFSYYF